MICEEFLGHFKQRSGTEDHRGEELVAIEEMFIALLEKCLSTI